MEFKFYNIFKKSLKDFYVNPILIISTLLLWILLVLLSKVSVGVNYKLESYGSIAITSWFVFFAVVSIGIMSFLFSGLIGMCREAIKEKSKLKDLAKYGKKYWFRNSQIMLIIILLSSAIYFASFYGAFYLGKAIGLEINSAMVLFFSFMFAGLIGILIFFSFSSFYLVIKDLGVINSIKRSFILVRKNYLFVLSIIIIFFVLYWLITFIGRDYLILAGVLEYLIVTPYLALVLTRFVMDFDK